MSTGVRIASYPVSAADDAYNFVPSGVTSYRVDSDAPPREFLFLLMPKLTMLALSSAIEPLRIANQLTGKSLYRWFTASEDGCSVTCSNGVKITPDASWPNQFDNRYAFVCGGVEPRSTITRSSQAWIRRQARFGRRFGGICTGAYHLANAGLLNQRRFTLHWENQPGFAEMFPDLMPSQNLFEKDGPVYSCGGGSAATDMMLSLIADDYGDELATMIAEMCIHGRSDLANVRQTMSKAALIGTRHPSLIKAVELMQVHMENPLTLEGIARRAGISRRQLERLFQNHVGVTPARYYSNMRLERGRALLLETDLSLHEVAAACGFGRAHFRRRYLENFNSNPAACRARLESR